MIAMQEHKNFWDKNAGRYDRFMRKDRAAYEEMYALIRPVVKAKTVLELATGTGLIAKHIVNAAACSKHGSFPSCRRCKGQEKEIQSVCNEKQKSRRWKQASVQNRSRH